MNLYDRTEERNKPCLSMCTLSTGEPDAILHLPIHLGSATIDFFLHANDMYATYLARDTPCQLIFMLLSPGRKQQRLR